MLNSSTLFQTAQEYDWLRQRVKTAAAYVPPELSEADQRADHQQRVRSFAFTRGIAEKALSERCSDHNAAPGEYCWPGTRGLCGARWNRGQLLNMGMPLVGTTGELHPAATAVRQAKRDMSFREFQERNLRRQQGGARR